jgi:ketosteroid isomerase-like protein
VTSLTAVRAGAGHRALHMTPLTTETALVDFVRRTYEAFDRGDFAAVADRLAPDFELELPALYLDASHYRGLEGAAQAWGRWTEDFDDFRWEPGVFLEIGDRVVVSIRERGRGHGSGVEIDHIRHHVLTVRNGRVTRLQIFFERDEALAAAGAN